MITKQKSNRVRGIESVSRRDQLNLSTVIEYAGKIHGYREVVTRMPGYWHRYTYRDMLERVRRLANVLEELGVKAGHMVGIWGTNTYRFMELQYAIVGMGATYHTVNWAIPFEHIVYSVNHGMKHAPYKIAFVEDTLLPVFEKVLAKIERGFDRYIIFGDKKSKAKKRSVEFYEDLLNRASSDFKWPEVDENTAVNYILTTGTTGRPKAVLSSHRANWLHSAGQAGSLSIKPMDNVMVLPPLYHGGWRLWVTSPMIGSKLVLPGPHPTAKDILDCILGENVTLTAAVPTLFSMILKEIHERKAHGEKIDLKGLTIIFGGQLPPQKLMKELDELGAFTMQVYGFTEGGPQTVYYIPRPLEQAMSSEEYSYFRHESSGYPVVGVRVKIIDEDGKELPWDGNSSGELCFKIPWGAKQYWHMPEETKKSQLDGWFRSGDLATIDETGCLRILDRIKDVIKSGGEWISAPLIEDLIYSFPGISETCVIGCEHEKWIERPVALVVLEKKQKGKVIQNDILEHLRVKMEEGKIAKWWIPDKVFFVDTIPKTSVGKFDKKLIRQQYRSVFKV